MRLLSQLNIDENTCCVSVCGSGGKSTLCYALACETVHAGRKAAITTTTHIGYPLNGCGEPFFSQEREKLRQILRSNKIPIAGKIDCGKICYGGDEQLQLLLEETDTVFIESDGSKMLPLKFPNGSEPVIPVQTDKILVVCGLSAWGRPLEEVCHRLRLAGTVLPDLGTAADADNIAALLWYGYGKYAPTYILNQADSDLLKEAGEKVREKLVSFGAEEVIVMSLKESGLAVNKYF